MAIGNKKECLVAEFYSREDARIGLEVLDTYDFTTDSVSVVALDQGKPIDDQCIEKLDHFDHQVKPSHSSSVGGVLGTLLGGAAAAPIAASTMVGPLFIAGPLAGMILGGVAGSALGGADHWGVDEETWRTYRQRVEEGSVLVIVIDEPEQIDHAEHGLKTTNIVDLERFALNEPTADE